MAKGTYPVIPVIEEGTLFKKLLVLENARNFLETELKTFTGQVKKQVETFLNLSEEDSLQEYMQIVKNLDEACNTIQQLSALFLELKGDNTNSSSVLRGTLCHRNASIDPESCLSLIPANPKHHVLPALKDSSAEKGFIISNVLKFGPILKNALMATSVANAVQTLGSTLALQQMRKLLTSHKEASSNTSAYYNLEIEVYRSLPGHKNHTYSDNSNVKPQEPLPLKKCDKVKSNIKDPCPSSNETVQSNVPAHLLGCAFGNGFKVQHQKQTSSQLINYLRLISKSGSVSEADSFNGDNMTSGTPHSASAAFWMHVRPGQKDIGSYHHTPEDSYSVANGLKQKASSTLDSSFPVFKLKGKSTDGLLTYSCMVATQSELWDVCDIFIQEENVPECVVEQNPSLPAGRHSESHCKETNDSQHLGSSGALLSSVGLEASSRNKQCVRIPEFRIRKFAEMEVTVTHVVDPGDFYIQNTGTELKELSQKLISQEWGQSFVQMKCIPDIGTYVVGWLPNLKLWCRALVVKICGIQEEAGISQSHGCLQNIKIELVRIDYGDKVCLALSDIRELSPELAAFPKQALCVSLANVSPVHGVQWSSEAIRWFKETVEDKILYARLYPQEDKVMAELFMEKGKLEAMRRGPSVSLRLAHAGHAKHCKMKNVHLGRRSSHGHKTKLLSEWKKNIISAYLQNRK
nr:PREDICTED: uncharacterized protein LOC107077856 isoform X1 [Lepisosteus oculatus]XP_015206798.1 PREDICTED: uncharacterized protein LOC107077856 isoform X1 [Lepisosteus oculatus]